MIAAMYWSGVPGDPPMIEMAPGHEPEELCDVITDDNAPIVPMVPDLGFTIRMPGGGLTPLDPELRRRALAELGMSPAEINAHTGRRLRVIGPVGGQRCPHGFIDRDHCVDCRH